MRSLVFATRNRGKLVELRELLTGISIVSALDLDLPEVVEDAPTFAGNAAKKAREVSAATGLPALADDSGLEVDALDGAPGVISARYAGPALGLEREEIDARNNTKLLAALAGVPPPRRTARFRAVLALADVRGPLGDSVITADGTCEGVILEAPRGTGGFGYDPLFFCPELGQTFAEAGVGTKSELSHRARAMRGIRPQLLAYLQQTDPQ
jgi:XTP/dITP diphosphohydrolase